MSSELPDIPDHLSPDTPPGTKSFPTISAELVASIALGLEDDLVVAGRHGISVEQFQVLQRSPHFLRSVENKRAEFKKEGVTFKAKAGWMAEELLDKVYVMAARDDASFSQTHEALKTMIKAAGLEPKPDPTAIAGPGFSISIDLGGGQSINLSNKPVAGNPVSAIDVDAKDISE